MQEHPANVQPDAIGLDVAVKPFSNDAAAQGVTMMEQIADKLVPVSEAIRYRKRAQVAEQQLDQARSELEQLQQQFGESQETIHSLERRQKIDALLADAETIDLEAARLLTEVTVQNMDDEDVAAAVDDLRRHKPYLFRHRQHTMASAMPARLLTTQNDHAQQAAERAVSSGDRRDLLHYLRLRRKT